MKVLVSAVSYGTGISGVQRHALNLVKALRTQSWIRELHVVLGPWQQTMRTQLGAMGDDRLQVHIADAGRNAFARNVWHLRSLPRLAEHLRVDMVHLTYPVPVNRAAIRSPIVVTLHDLYPYEIPENFGFPKCLANRWILRSCLESADGIACVSASTRNGLAVRAGSAIVQKAVQVCNCVEPLPEPQRPHFAWTQDPFLLCVAQHRRNKNVPFLLRAFRMLHLTGQVDESMLLAIVGMSGPESVQVRRSIASLGLSERVRLIEDVTDAELRWCYEGCEALVAPSLIEGFGLPVVEALQHGARVVCSDIPAFREFGAGMCRFVQLDGPTPEARFAQEIVQSLMQPKPLAQQFPALSSTSVGAGYGDLYQRLQGGEHRVLCPITRNLASQESRGVR